MAEQATAEKTEAGKTLLTAELPEKQAAEKTLSQAQSGALNPVEAAKQAAIKELADKASADEAAKKAADQAEAAKKAEAEKTKTEAETKPTPKKDGAQATEYTLELPENSAMTKEDLATIAKQAKDLGLAEDKAKELVKTSDQMARAAKVRFSDQQTEQLKTMHAQWQESVKNDPELGGEKLAETAIKSNRAAKVIFDAPTLKFLNDTGYGDHPGLVRAMVKVYDLIGEDKFIKGTTGASAPGTLTTEQKAKKLFSNPITDTVISTK